MVTAVRPVFLQEGDIDIAKGLLQAGINVNAKLDGEGRTVQLTQLYLIRTVTTTLSRIADVSTLFYLPRP